MFIDKIAWLYIKDRKVLSTRSKGKDVYYFPGGNQPAFPLLNCHQSAFFNQNQFDGPMKMHHCLIVERMPYLCFHALISGQFIKLLNGSRRLSEIDHS